MMSFMLASGNAHKAEEFKELFNGTLSISAAPAVLDIPETGSTFVENAATKAEGYFKAYALPTMADDSGLVIEALPDIMGVHTANFASDLKDYSERCQRIPDLMKEKKNRKAMFVCLLCFYTSPDEIHFFEGRLTGTIAMELKGDGGFGYDPIFVPDRKENDGKTLAELPEWKNEFSHRAKATHLALQFFKVSMDKTRK